MKPFVSALLALIFFGVVASLTARQSQPPPFKTIVVDRFVNSNGATQSAEFIQSSCDSMRDELLKLNLASQVVEEGVTVNAADAPGSLIIAGKFTSYAKGGVMWPGKVGVEIDVYRASDHALVKTLTPTIAYRRTPLNTDKSLGRYVGGLGSHYVQQGLKGVTLASVAPAAATPRVSAISRQIREKHPSVPKRPG